MIKFQLGHLKPLQLATLIGKLYQLNKSGIKIDLKGEYIEGRQHFFLQCEKKLGKTFKEIKSLIQQF